VAESDFDQVCDDIASTLGAATGIAKFQSFDELTEGVADYPLLQVYPEEGETDANTSNDRTTFRAGVRVCETAYNVDVYCRPRGNIAQDMKAAVDALKALQAKLETVKTKPYFGNETIKGFSWSWRRVTLEPVDGQKYAGLRFVIKVRQF
jgi:hypothetical protein